MTTNRFDLCVDRAGETLRVGTLYANDRSAAVGFAYSSAWLARTEASPRQTGSSIRRQKPTSPARILQISQRYTLLRVHGNRWLPMSHLPFGPARDELKLGISVRVLSAFDGLAIGL